MKKNQDGRYYRKTFFVPGVTESGQPKRVIVRGKTKKEVEEKYAEAKRQHGLGLSLGETTVAEWAERWFRIYKANASDTQKAHYAAKLNHDILPFIGHIPVRDIRASHLQELLNSYAGGKVGTVQKIKIAVRQLFNDAELEGLIEKNPARRLELPSLTEKTRRPLTEYERAVVYNVAQSHKCGVFVLTMLFCGLRRGEAIALRIGDIDFKNSRININKSLKLTGNIGIEKDTKSKAGLREVPIPDILLPFLVACCENKVAEDLLFPKSDGKHATQQTCRWWWKSFLRQCHIAAGAEVYRNKVLLETSPFSNEITPHYMRHTYATDLYAAGVDEKAQKEFLGHSSADVTDVYRKMNETAFYRALHQLNEYYKNLDFSIENNVKK